MHRLYLVFALIACAAIAWAQETPAGPSGRRPAMVTVNPQRVEAEVGQQLKFTAVGLDEAGNRMDEKPSAWFAAPFDLAAADDAGNVTLYLPGEVRVGAMIGGKAGFATVVVKPQNVARIEIQPMTSPVVVGGGAKVSATARTANGDPRSDVDISWTSDAPAIATIDTAGFVTGIAPGRATLRASSGSASATVAVEVVRNPVRNLTVEPKSAKARTGDVVHFAAQASGADGTPVKNPSVRWAVSGDGATVEPDGGFVAERPGNYVVTAISGDRSAVATVIVTPRNVDRELVTLGRAQEEFQAAEQWIIGNYAYVSSLMAGRLWVYDISNPAGPVKVDSLPFDARVINDVSTTADGKIGLITREGASNRKNGIVFLDTSDLAHPKVITEYTETVTGGVHSAFIDGHYVYLTDDATGSLRVIDFRDPKSPKEVARWEVQNPMAKTIEREGVGFSAGRYLHDVYVKDGLIYMGYWRDGLVILDVGNGMKGGSPEKPQFVSQLRFNYHELYGSGWLAGAHSVFRYKNYVFVGDEVFPGQPVNLADRARIPVKGIVHVVDVSDIEHPRKVAWYEVPEAGSHNFWVENDVLYMGYYNGGARVLDVSGELRGDLYRQGREMARLWTGDPKGYRANLPFTWGAQPHKGLVYFNDINTGLWITRLSDPKDRSGR